MRKTAFLFLTPALLLQHALVVATDEVESTLVEQVFAAPTEETPSATTLEKEIPENFSPFTGKVVRDKVRLRLQANLDSTIIETLNRSDLLVIVGKEDDFYAVEPPPGTKAYVFRTFILDGKVEGSHVNIRLEPSLEAAVIAQLNSGDQVNGKINPENTKWLEITPPKSTRFYIYKDYIENIGAPSLITQLQGRRDEATHLLNSTYLLTQSEMQKPFDEIDLDSIIANFNRVIKEYADFPREVAHAKELLLAIQDGYLQKKIAYLETKTHAVTKDWQIKNAQLSAEIEEQKERLDELDSSPKTDEISFQKLDWDKNPKSGRQAIWIPKEEAFYQDWIADNGEISKDDFYAEQREDATDLKGVLELYDRPVRNKPGDYLLLDSATNLPIAYLYSTDVNLQDQVGKEVKIWGASRPNNHFAFPAYFVLSVE